MVPAHASLAAVPGRRMPLLTASVLKYLALAAAALGARRAGGKT